ncbi:MAG: cytochrome c biogenesis protein ResB [Actinomycetales bacterium]|nr:cytochrome c biogenesis protein ResB [Actinomycetales bacterium]
MTAIDPGQSPLPPLGTVGFARWAWRQLTSMRTALILLFLLAVASVPGTVLPQRGNDPIAVRTWIEDAPTTGPILDRLGFFEVYSSPWFSAVYLLLFISLIGCVIPRARHHWQAMRAAPPPAPRNLMRLPDAMTWQGPAGAVPQAAAYLRARRWRVVTGGTPASAESPATHWVAAEKGYLRETGNLVFHLALLLILLAVAVGGLLGWKGNVIVREGRGFANTLTQYDAWGGGRLVDPAGLPPFSFTLDSFAVDFERTGSQRGAPRSFAAEVTYRSEPAAQPQSAVIEVNHPLEVDGTKVFLVGHGYAPHFVVTDRTGTVVFDDDVPFLPQDGNFTSTGVVKVPDGQPQLGVQGLFLPTAALDDVRGPHSVFPAADDPAVFLSAWQGDLGLDGGAPQSVYSLDTAKMTQIGLEALRPGQSWELPGGQGRITFTGYVRWASFQIAHDPGKELALVGALLAIGGLMCSLFIQRRRIWVKVIDADADGDAGPEAMPAAGAPDAPTGARTTVVQVAGMTRTSTLDDLQAPALLEEMKALAEDLRSPGKEES